MGMQAKTAAGRKKLLLGALEDGVKKSLEMAAVTAVTGYPAETILMASAAVFAGSLTFKTLKYLA